MESWGEILLLLWPHLHIKQKCSACLLHHFPPKVQSNCFCFFGSLQSQRAASLLFLLPSFAFLHFIIIKKLDLIGHSNKTEPGSTPSVSVQSWVMAPVAGSRGMMGNISSTPRLFYLQRGRSMLLKTLNHLQERSCIRAESMLGKQRQTQRDGVQSQSSREFLWCQTCPMILSGDSEEQRTRLLVHHQVSLSSMLRLSLGFRFTVIRTALQLHIWNFPQERTSDLRHREGTKTPEL